MEQSKLCVIGTGNHATLNLYPAIKQAGAAIVGIAARHLEHAASAANAFSPEAHVYDDYRAMLAEVPCDGVVISAQPGDQYNIALDCISRGIAVFVEKPLGWTAEEAEALAKAAEAAGVQVMVGFMKRYAPCYRKIAELVRNNTLGRVVSFHVNFAADTAMFCKTPEDFAKLAAIHLIDLTRALFGEVQQVQSMPVQNGENITISASCKMESGAVGNLYLCSAGAWSREPESMVVTFEKGFAMTSGLAEVTIHEKTAESAGPPYAQLAEADTRFTVTDTPMSGGRRDLYLRGFVGEIEHFIGCLQSGAAPFSSAQDNVKTMQLCEALTAER